MQVGLYFLLLLVVFSSLLRTAYSLRLCRVTVGGSHQVSREASNVEDFALVLTRDWSGRPLAATTCSARVHGEGE